METMDQNQLRLAQMKKAVREALPQGAGDLTVTDVAKAALKVAEGWERRTLDPCGDGNTYIIG